MPYQAFESQWKTFTQLVDAIPTTHDEKIQTLLQRYVEQNLIILNDVLQSSIENLQRLQKAENSNDIICMQARLTTDVSKKLSLSAQRFLNASLGHIADYNDWLKAHCDLATD